MNNTSGNSILLDANSSSGVTSRIGLIDTISGSVDTQPAWFIDNVRDTFRIFRQPDINTS
jgi:hypothetical protein